MNSHEIAARIQSILPEIRQEYGVQDLWLFGSYVRSSQTDASDVDILVTFDNPDLSLIEFIQLEQKLTDLLGTKVDLVERDSLKPVIGQDIMQEAIAL